ncbi:MAG: hypothetical protein OER88_05685 [Planctomycetota bacterium]|nr:hypothetical protein [Planctomycetota bacterium]
MEELAGLDDGQILIIGARVEDSEELLAHLGLPDLLPAREQPLAEAAGNMRGVAVAEHRGHTVLAGHEWFDFWAAEWTAFLSGLIEEYNAHRVVRIWVTSIGPFAYAIMDKDGTGVMRVGGSSGIQQHGNELAQETGAAKETGFHPWEVEFLGTHEPPRDDQGRPMKGTTEFPEWGPQFARSLVTRMLKAGWEKIPAVRYVDPNDASGPPEVGGGGCVLFLAAALTLALLALG